VRLAPNFWPILIAPAQVHAIRPAWRATHSHWPAGALSSHSQGRLFHLPATAFDRVNAHAIVGRSLARRRPREAASQPPHRAVHIDVWLPTARSTLFARRITMLCWRHLDALPSKQSRFLKKLARYRMAMNSRVGAPAPPWPPMGHRQRHGPVGPHIAPT
jgi:hypothetical protein